ncbi:MAG TPA: hypothetical protein VJR87_04585 [Allosphingosinicella sp.]|nr:hypothetical protein [Allosphingosinicella sp.]HKT14664.1 hypothetical protein [Allosphingosinicella sp.]
MPKHPHILNAASNLLGIALVIIAALNVTQIAHRTLADEVAWLSAICLSLSCLLSYVALRAEPRRSRCEDFADHIFLVGLLSLFASVVVLALSPH